MSRVPHVMRVVFLDSHVATACASASRTIWITAGPVTCGAVGARLYVSAAFVSRRLAGVSARTVKFVAGMSVVQRVATAAQKCRTLPHFRLIRLRFRAQVSWRTLARLRAVRVGASRSTITSILLRISARATTDLDERIAVRRVSLAASPARPYPAQTTVWSAGCRALRGTMSASSARVDVGWLC